MYLAGRVAPNSEARIEMYGLFGFCRQLIHISILLVRTRTQSSFYHLALKSEIPYELVPRARE